LAAASNPAANYPRVAVPLAEIEATAELIRSHPEYFTDPLEETYASMGLEVLADPFGREVSDRAAQALNSAIPFSVIRLGDAEMNLLAFGAYGTPGVDRFCAAASLGRWPDSFFIGELAMMVVREMLLSAVLQADVVGVRRVGIGWREGQTAETFAEQLPKDLRGRVGAWRAVDHCLRLAQEGVFKHKTLASAHLYFGLLKHLDVVLPRARRVILITSRPSALPLLQNRFPALAFDLIRTGQRKDPLPHAPVFLAEVATSLPSDMRECCALIGAALWGKVYCSWVKQRGGVALDLGSGFDLLSGVVTRPVHRRLGLDKVNPYALETSAST
jgi:hypothetical protein